MPVRSNILEIILRYKKVCPWVAIILPCVKYPCASGVEIAGAKNLSRKRK